MPEPLLTEMELGKPDGLNQVLPSLGVALVVST